MKNLAFQLRLASLLSLILLACSATYGQITPLGDTYSSSTDPTTNYGAQKTLNVDAAKEITYIQFNLASVPTGASISQATLKLYVNTVIAAGAFEIYAVNGTWTESALTYSLAPALGSVIDSNVPITTADKNQYILIPVTSTVQGWLNTPSSNNGIALVAVGSFDATFDSKETATTSHPPELDIVFAGGGSGITGITTAAGSGLTGGGTSGTLNLSLTTCGANQVLQYNGSAWACASAGTGTITGVLAGTDLTGGGTSGNVTLNLNTAATNALYAQLGAGNTFTTNQTVDGTITANTGNTVGVIGNTTSSAFEAAGVAGNATASTGSTLGMFGQASSPGGWGVAGSSPFAGVVGINNNGWAFSTAGAPYGVIGDSLSVGVYGASSGASVTGGSVIHPTGLWGDYGGATGTGFGMLGTVDDNWAGAFYNNSSTHAALFGLNDATTGSAQGVFGETSSPSGYGVEGVSPYVGVIGNSSTSSGYGVAGNSPYVGVFGGQAGLDFSSVGAPYGVVGSSPTIGVYGALNSISGFTPPSSGVWGDTGTSGGSSAGITGTAAFGVGGLFVSAANYAGEFQNFTNTLATIFAINDTESAGGGVFVGQMPYLGTNGQAIIGDPGCGAGSGRMAIQLSLNGMSNCTNYTLTGGSNGETYLNAVAGESVHLRVNNVDSLRATSTGVAVVGTLSKGGGSFLIDHPLDPGNKYLYHSFVESPDMKNIYDGTITTDGAGVATVTLPDWFEALNRDFRYQLTVIGQFAQAIVASKVANNQFRIQTDKPNVEVSWQVTGIRQDAFANANRIPVEAEKAPADRGRYLYPEAIGAPATARIGYEAVPPESEQVVHQQRPNVLSRNASPARTITFPAPLNPELPKLTPSRHAAQLSHPATQAIKPGVNQK